jgi:hypothetical protein
MVCFLSLSVAPQHRIHATAPTLSLLFPGQTQEHKNPNPQQGSPECAATDAMRAAMPAPRFLKRAMQN